MENLVRPSGTLTLAGKDYKLDSSFATLAAVEESLQMDILQVSAAIPEMRVGQVARVIAAATPLKTSEAGQMLIDEVNIASADYQKVKGQLMAWLFVSIAPKVELDAKVKRAGELLAGLETPPASPGKTTRKSASVG